MGSLGTLIITAQLTFKEELNALLVSSECRTTLEQPIDDKKVNFIHLYKRF